MTMIIKFVGSFRSTSGKSKLPLKFENSITLKGVIKRIVKELPDLKRALIDPELQEPKTSMLILVNGKEISVLNGLQTIIKDKDEVIFVPVVHGG